MTAYPLPVQTDTPLDLMRLPDKAELVKAFVGKPLSSLRTPAIVLDRTRFARNCEAMSASCVRQGITFRAHVKTHKAIEGVRMQLTAGQGCSAVVCSTLMECWQIVREGLVQEGLVKDMLYGLPCGLDKLQDLKRLAAEMGKSNAVLRLMIDHPDQIRALGGIANPNGAWSIFIKVDGGGKRAGLPPTSQAMHDLVALALSSPHISIHGFYSHFGQSYASTSTDEAAAFLRGEVDCVSSAAKLALSLGSAPSTPYTLSVGATPTAHAIDMFKSSGLPGVLELHAGNYCCLDLQQFATKQVPLESVATSVLTHVISSYPHRNEAMCDAGAIAMARDSGPLAGFGQVVWPERMNGWDLGRMSQEHGTLTRREADAPEVRLGEMLRIVGQHACVTLAAHPWFYCVDDGGEVVTDVWVPWKGW